MWFLHFHNVTRFPISSLACFTAHVVRINTTSCIKHLWMRFHRTLNSQLTMILNHTMMTKLHSSVHDIKLLVSLQAQLDEETWRGIIENGKCGYKERPIAFQLHREAYEVKAMRRIMAVTVRRRGWCEGMRNTFHSSTLLTVFPFDTLLLLWLYIRIEGKCAFQCAEGWRIFRVRMDFQKKVSFPLQFWVLMVNATANPKYF